MKKIICVGIIAGIMLVIMIYIITLEKYDFSEYSVQIADNVEGIKLNVLGGNGHIKSCKEGANIQQPFFDDKNIYYVDGSDGRTMVARDRKNGGIRDVCEKAMCDHRTEECILYELYHNDFPFYYILDDNICYYASDDQKISLYLWNSISNKKTKVYEFPAKYEIQVADNENITMISGIDLVGRVNEEIVMVYSGMYMYLFDNDFNIVDRISCGRETRFAFYKDYILIIKSENVIKYCLKDKSKTEINISLQNKKISAGYFYSYHNSLIYALEDEIYKYDLEESTITSIVGYDIHSPFSVIDNQLFYFMKGKICGFNLEENIKIEADLINIPNGRTDDAFVIYDAKVGGYTLGGIEG